MRLVPFVVMVGCGFNAPAGAGMGTDAAIDGDAVPRDDAPDDTAIDGPPIDMAIPMCVAGGTMDTFQSNTPCDPWATTDSNGAQTSQNGGKLRIAGPSAATGSTHGGCFAINLSAFGPEGLFIQVEQAMAGGYTGITAYVASGTPAGIKVQNGEIDVHNPMTSSVAGMKAYDSTQMRWWRLRPVTGGVLGETSPDAVSWTPLGTVMGPPPTQIRIDISAGTTGIVTGAGTAIFDNLDVCP